MSCPALQLETPKAQRGRFCHSKKNWKQRETGDVAARLVQLLRQHRNQFPGFASRIDSFIAQVESDALRSRSYDRERVLGLLEAWSLGLTVKELMEDTGFSHWDVRQILGELVRVGKVLKTDEPRNGTRVTVYRLP